MTIVNIFLSSYFYVYPEKVFIAGFKLLSMFQEILLVMIAFSGYPAGQVLANLSEAEVKDRAGKRWFRVLRSCALAAISLLLLIYYFHYPVLLVPFLILGAFTLYTLRTHERQSARTMSGIPSSARGLSARRNARVSCEVTKQKEFIGYLLVLFSLILAISQKDKDLNFLVASLIFIYLAASVAVIRGEKRVKG